MLAMTDDKESLEQLARRSESGDPAAFGELLELARGQLEAWIRLRLGARLRASIEPSTISSSALPRRRRRSRTAARTGRRTT
jgi:hypothetical protein